MSANSESLTQQILPAALDAFHGLPAELQGGHGFGPSWIGGAALLLAGGLVAGDEIATRRRPLRTTPLLEVIPPVDEKTSGVVIGYAPGFNSHPQNPGHIYARTAQEYGAVIIEHDPESGYEPELSYATFAEKFLELGAEKVVLIGDSAGGIKQLSKAAYLLRRGIDTEVVQVSTPNSKHHIKGLHRHAMLALLDCAGRLGFQGGDGFRQFAEMVGYKIDNPHRPLQECLAHTRRKFSGEAAVVTSPQVIKYARLLRRHNTAADIRTLGADRIQFASADDPVRDPVVRVDESHGFLEEHAGGSVRWLRHPRLNHANVCEVPAAAQDIVRWSFANLGILSIEERRAKIA